MTSINDHLTPGETILVENRPPHSRATFYATEKRVIRYEKGMFSENLSDLAYKSITSVNLVSNLRYPLLIILGIAFAILGFLIGKDGSILVILGIISTIIGIVWKKAYFQFIAMGIGIDNPEATKWQIYGAESDEAQQFVRTVREHLT